MRAKQEEMVNWARKEAVYKTIDLKLGFNDE